MKLLKDLCEIQSPSGNESQMAKFLLTYIRKEKKHWKVQPEIFCGEELQDCIVLKFGSPRTAVFAHMDTVGFTVRYENQLLPIGSPNAETGTILVGQDSFGPIECALEYDAENHALYRFARTIERGTTLTYQARFHETKTTIESPYLDNRLGIYTALKTAEKLKDGVIVFSCWEEHGGGSVPYLAKFIYERWKVRQALIADITWITDGVLPMKGVAISLRDRNIPGEPMWTESSKSPVREKSDFSSKSKVLVPAMAANCRHRRIRLIGVSSARQSIIRIRRKKKHIRRTCRA